MKRIFFSTCVILFIASAAQAQMRITEWMYKPGAGPAEYIEFTNVGTTDVNMAGWSEDDSHQVSGTHSLSAFGTVQPGESAIACDGNDAAGFRSYWGLSSTVKVVTYGGSDNLGNGDEINLYDNLGTLIDRLTYGTTPSTSGVSANIPWEYLGLNQSVNAVLSSPADVYGSYKAGGTGDIGNPGIYTPYNVPEPATILALLTGMLMAGILTRFRRK